MWSHFNHVLRRQSTEQFWPLSRNRCFIQHEIYLVIAYWAEWTSWSDCQIFKINKNVKISQVGWKSFPRLINISCSVELDWIWFSNHYKRTRSCECNNCTVYCNGKAFERKICGYVNACANDSQCLPASASTTSASIADPSMDDEMDGKQFSCWTQYDNHKIKSDYRLQYSNGTEIPNSKNLKRLEAKRRCLILGPDICKAFTNMMTGSNQFALRSEESAKESFNNRITYSLNSDCMVKDCSVFACVIGLVWA